MPAQNPQIQKPEPKDKYLPYILVIGIFVIALSAVVLWHKEIGNWMNGFRESDVVSVGPPQERVLGTSSSRDFVAIMNVTSVDSKNRKVTGVFRYFKGPTPSTNWVEQDSYNHTSATVTVKSGVDIYYSDPDKGIKKKKINFKDIGDGNKLVLKGTVSTADKFTGTFAMVRVWRFDLVGKIDKIKEDYIVVEVEDTLVNPKPYRNTFRYLKYVSNKTRVYKSHPRVTPISYPGEISLSDRVKAECYYEGDTIVMDRLYKNYKD